MDQVLINGVNYPINLGFKCLRPLSERLGHKSPITTIRAVGEIFQPLFDAYADIDESEFDQVDSENITYEQIELFRHLTICAIQAATPGIDFDIPEEDSFTFFTNNAAALGVIMVGFVKATVPQDTAIEPGKPKRTKKGPKKNMKKQKA